MSKNELIFDNLKSLRTIASIEAFSSNSDFINNVLWKELHANKSFLSTNFEKFDLNFEIINQLYRLNLLLKDAEIAFLLEKIEEKNEITSKPNLSNVAEVNNVMNDIKMAISSAKEDISRRGNQDLCNSLPIENEKALSGTKLTKEIKHYIEDTLNKFLRENLDNILDEAIAIKKDKKSKVLDLSEVAVSPKITPNK